MNNVQWLPRPARRGALLIAVLMATAAVCADELKLELRVDAEVPPVKTMAAGSGTITTNGVVGTMVHSYHGAPGTDGPVLIPLTKSGTVPGRCTAATKLTDAQYSAY